MEKSSPGIFQNLLRGIASVFLLNGAGIANAVRGFPLWVPLLIVAVGGIPFWYLGSLWLIQVWILFAFSARLMLKAFANDSRERGDFISVLKLIGWCMIPIIVFMLFIGADDVLDNLVIHIIPGLWGVFAFGAGWSAMTGMSKVASIISGLIGLAIVGIVQVGWVVLILIWLSGLE